MLKVGHEKVSEYNLAVRGVHHSSILTELTLYLLPTRKNFPVFFRGNTALAGPYVGNWPQCGLI